MTVKSKSEKLGQNGSDHLAGAAPGGPEVQHNCLGVIQNSFLEIGFGYFDLRHIHSPYALFAVAFVVEHAMAEAFKSYSK